NKNCRSFFNPYSDQVFDNVITIFLEESKFRRHPRHKLRLRVVQNVELAPRNVRHTNYRNTTNSQLTIYYQHGTNRQIIYSGTRCLVEHDFINNVPVVGKDMCWAKVEVPKLTE